MVHFILAQVVGLVVVLLILMELVGVHLMAEVRELVVDHQTLEELVEAYLTKTEVVEELHFEVLMFQAYFVRIQVYWEDLKVLEVVLLHPIWFMFMTLGYRFSSFLAYLMVMEEAY